MLPITQKQVKKEAGSAQIGEAFFELSNHSSEFLILELLPFMNGPQSSCSCLCSTDSVVTMPLTASPEDMAHVNAYRELSKLFILQQSKYLAGDQQCFQTGTQSRRVPLLGVSPLIFCIQHPSNRKQRPNSHEKRVLRAWSEHDWPQKSE